MLLAIDTATAACSAALIADNTVCYVVRETVGRGHAERLVPMIEDLIRDAGQSVPTGILVDCGPGSFTGIRVGLAAGIGLAMGWGIPVAGCSSLALVAARFFEDTPSAQTCTVALNGGHGELFFQRFATHPFAAMGPLASMSPDDAARSAPDEHIVGSGAATLVAARRQGVAIEALPDAADAALLPSAYRLLPARPIYGRDADAKPKAA